MKMFVLSDNVDTKLGMRIAGVEGVVVHTAEEVEEKLKAVFADSEIGIVLITHQLIALCPERITDYKLHYKRPLIVEIPDRHKNSQISDTISRYIQESVGIKI
jgi:V/A-type H+-transporting ATPase subunit F